MSSGRVVRSDKEWMNVIIECRRSGLSDAEWCRQNEIPTSTFYNAVNRLRKKACRIPDPAASRTGPVLDLTSPGPPDVVQVCVKPEKPLAPVQESTTHLDNSHRIEILLGNACIRISNGADPVLLSTILTSLGRALC